MKCLVSVLAAAFLAISASSHAAPPLARAPEQAVIVHFEYGQPDRAPFLLFEKELEAKIASSEAGEYDGNELAVGGHDGTLYIYGPDADKLFAVVKPILQSFTLLRNVIVTLRYGAVEDKNARVRTVPLGS